MSKRKQQAIEAARRAAQAPNEIAAGKSWQGKLTSSKVLVSIGICLLLTLAAVGAVVGNNRSSMNNTGSDSWLGKMFLGSAPSQPAAAPLLPTPTPPQLAREYVYAGGAGRLLAIEEAGANSPIQPADLVVWRKSSGSWLIRDSTDGTTQTNVFGGANDLARPADFDGDGQSDFCVFRPDAAAQTGTWYIQPNNGGTAFYGFQFGLHSDVPVPADFDGDRRADIAVWRNSVGQFIVLESSSNLARFISVGQAGGSNQTPAPADFDGDGRADAAVWESTSGNWTILQSSTNQVRTVQFGTTGDAPVPGDYDGDAIFDPSVWRPGGAGTWYYLSSVTGHHVSGQVIATAAGDIAVAGDYDGDGKTDMAIWRPSNGYWHIQKSSTGTLWQQQWGATGDVPIAAPMKR